MSMCGMLPCRHCGKPVQTVWGTAEWHAGHDPVGGYCQCVLNEFRQLAEAAKAKLESDKFQEMREACETYLRPKGNMQSREDYVVKSFERRGEYDRVCSPDAVLSTLDELDRLRAEVASLKEEIARLNHQALFREGYYSALSAENVALAKRLEVKLAAAPAISQHKSEDAIVRDALIIAKKEVLLEAANAIKTMRTETGWIGKDEAERLLRRMASEPIGNDFEGEKR